MSPDFEYFLRLSARGSYGHTFCGVFVLDLPMSLVVLWLYQQFAKRALVTVAPGLFPFEQKSLIDSRVANSATQWIVVLMSILIGAATHILWDSFTHPGFWPGQHLTLLQLKLNLPFFGTILCFKFLQYLSTLAGMSVLIFLWLKWISSSLVPPKPVRVKASLLLVGFALSGSVIRTIAGGKISHAALLSEAVISFILLLWVEIVVYGAALSLRESLLAL